ncbi:MAG: hypothetical protein A3I72_06235 [Candidatus Tectomicrobia bacterium RIFCSPLOWO2_02_FULL_70_19]|nr:MAG: hypothetical protein A3I72_06235 [Candidatus Tectomicrobia bacterium RIFCSPLOWO2_02_FULL_70_19]
MARSGKLSKGEQTALAERLRDWIRQEQGRGIPMDSILLACQECGLLPLLEKEEEEPPVVED